MSPLRYYQSVGSSTSLEDAFKAIKDQIKTDTMDLGTETQVKDVLSDTFAFANDQVDESDVTVSVVPYNGKDSGGNDQWKEKEKAPAAGTKVTVNQATKEVSVSGYDFKKNFVGTNEKGEAVGSKLVIEFAVKPMDGFIGGNNVATNDQSASGVYDKDGTSLKNFELPNVNVPLNFGISLEDRNIHVGDRFEIGDLEKVFCAQDETGELSYTTSAGGKAYTLDGKTNAYVNLTYQVKDAGGNVIGEYAVPAGATSGSWKWKDGSGTLTAQGKFTEPENETQYTVDLVVTPTSETPDSNGTSAVEAETIPGSADAHTKPTIHVYRPAVTCSDEIIFLGETAGDLSGRYSGVWKCGDKTATASTEFFKGDRELVLEAEWGFGTELPATGEYKPEEDSGFKVKVFEEWKYGTGTVSKTDITGYAAITKGGQGCGICSGPSSRADFTIHVLTGSLALTKTIGAADDAAFTFKIDYEGENGETDTWYRTVRFTEGGATERTAEALTGLPKGNYRVTELGALKYTLKNVAADGGATDCKYEKDAAGITFEIGGTGTGTGGYGTCGKAVFHNTKSGSTTLTGVDVKWNVFHFGENTSADDLKAASGQLGDCETPEPA